MILDSIRRFFGGDEECNACEEALSRLQEFVDGELDDSAREEVEAHFRECTACSPHLSMEEEFRRHVVEPFVDDYLAGRTPVPCTRCNTCCRRVEGRADTTEQNTATAGVAAAAARRDDVHPVAGPNQGTHQQRDDIVRTVADDHIRRGNTVGVGDLVC